jgi:hypothetical protein
MLPLRPDEVQLLQAFLESVIPPDHDPGAGEAGVLSSIEERIEANIDLYRSGLMLLADRGFSRLSPPEREAVLAEIEGHPTIAMMISHAIEGYYAGPQSAGARAVGFRVTV